MSYDVICMYVIMVLVLSMSAMGDKIFVAAAQRSESEESDEPAVGKDLSPPVVVENTHFCII
jgi:hypothetical protein